MEWECFWVTLREDNKVSEFKMAVAESKMAEFKMASIIKWSQNEWVKFFCANIGEGSVSEVFFVQMVGTNVGNCEWVWVWWPIPRWHILRWLPSSRIREWVKFILCKWWEPMASVNLRGKTKMADSKMYKFKMVEWWLPSKLSQNEWVFFCAKTKMAVNLRGKTRWPIQDGWHHQVRLEWMS